MLKITHRLPGAADKKHLDSAGYVRYMATRPGVALVEELADERVLLPDGADAETYAKYISERPRSHGLFGVDPAGQPDLAATMKEVAEAQKRGPTWRLIISLREEDAVRASLHGPGEWRELTRRIMGRFSSEAMGLSPEQVQWVGAYHPETGHPHVHVEVWTTAEAPIRRGVLTKDELKAARRIVTQEIFGPELSLAIAEKTVQRDLVLEGVKREVLALVPGLKVKLKTLEPGTPALPPRFAEGDVQELRRRLRRLAAQMPGHGRAALKLMPEPVKAEARAVADYLLGLPQMAGHVAGVTQSARDISSLYTRQEDALQAAAERAREDVRDRVAQLALKAAVGLEHREETTVRTLMSAVHSMLWAERTKAEARSLLAAEAHVRELERRAKRGYQYQERGW